MKNFRLYFFFLLSTVFFTSCLEITEEVELNADGSGAAIMTVNLSESKDNLKNYLSQGEFQGQKLPTIDDISEMIKEVESVMQTVDGLSNVQSESNFEDFVFKFSGDFTDVEVLNKAVNVLATEMSKKNPTAPKPVIKDNFSASKGKFKRHFDYPIDTEIYGKLGMMEQFFMENARIVGIYRFPTVVKEKSNAKANLSPSKKAVMLKTNVAQLMKGETTVANEISY